MRPHSRSIAWYEPGVRERAPKKRTTRGELGVVERVLTKP
jgi:hypothetical protein